MSICDDDQAPSMRNMGKRSAGLRFMRGSASFIERMRIVERMVYNSGIGSGCRGKAIEQIEGVRANAITESAGGDMMDRVAAEKRDKLERYRHLNQLVRPGQILFAGSSLMEQFPIYELLLDHQLPYTIYNRGIGGYTTQELLDTMDVCIYDLHPEYIYLNIGTNDLNGPDYCEAEFIDRYKNIVKGIYEHLPYVNLFLLAYYPVNPAAAPNAEMEEVFRWRTNDRIRLANAAVKKMAEESGAVFISLNAGITDENGELKMEYTIDGMHMYADGYVPVLRAMMPYLPDIEKEY